MCEGREQGGGQEMEITIVKGGRRDLKASQNTSKEYFWRMWLPDKLLIPRTDNFVAIFWK